MIPWSLVDCANISKEHTASVFKTEEVVLDLPYYNGMKQLCWTGLTIME